MCRNQIMSSGARISWKLQEYNAHVGSVGCVSLGKKSGRLLATGGDDKKVNIWSLDKPNCLLSLTGHEHSITAVKLNDSETLLGSACDSGVLKIWDLDATKNLNSLRGHKGAAIRSIEFYPMEGYVASTSVDCTVKLWDLRRKGCIHTFKGHSDAVGCVQFSPDARWMISGDDKGVIKIWEIRVNKELCEFAQHSGAITAIQCHPCELLLASGSTDGSIKFWDLCSMKLINSTQELRGITEPLGTIMFHPEGQCVYGAAKGLINVFGWEPVKEFASVNLTDATLPKDVAIAHNQLTGACISQSKVSTFVVEVSKMSPIGGNTSPSLVNGESGRKTFIAGHVAAPPPKERNHVPSSSDNDGGGDNDVEIKDPSFKRDQRVQKPFRPPGTDADDDHADQNQLVGDGFDAQGAYRMSDVEALNFLKEGHIAFSSVMARRHKSLRMVRSEWMSGSHRSAVDMAVGMKDYSVMSDLLKVLLSNVAFWDLSMCQTLLPVLGELVNSKHDNYIHIGLSSLRLVGHQFGDTIRTNVTAPPPPGMVDFARNERYKKSLACFNVLLSIRSILGANLNRHEGRLGDKIQEMYALIQRITDR